MTRVKICGITGVDDALSAVEAGVDALGFVFAPSPRRITPRQAGAIVSGLPPLVRTFGVFVDASCEEIEAAIAESGIDAVQLHGNEPPTFCDRLSRPVLKRIGVTPADGPEALRRRAAAYDVAAVLLDPGAGDGRVFRWDLACAVNRPLVLAGGLHPGNVGEAIRTVRPYGVDVSSGVETVPGRKDPDRVRAFLEAVRREDASHRA